jgi:hypothetical protein
MDTTPTHLVVLFDERDFFACLCGLNGCPLSSGTRADYNKIKLRVWDFALDAFHFP